MKTFQMFLCSVVILLSVVYLTAGRANRPTGPASESPTALADKADKGDPEAAYELAVRSALGIRKVDQSWNDSRHWAERAAKAGKPEAGAALAVMMIKGVGGMREPEAGFDMLKKAKEAGVPAAFYAEGMLKLQSESDEIRRTGFEVIKEAEEMGSARAAYRLGLIYRDGDKTLGVKPDMAAAMKHLEIAGKKADPEACGELGLLYMKTDSMDKDDKLCEAWAWLAAAEESDKKWQKLMYEVHNDINGQLAREYEPAVSFSKREYGAAKYRPELASLTAEKKDMF